MTDTADTSVREGVGPGRPLDLAILRHGLTDWNTAGRLQGQADRPLSAAGRERVAAWTLPPGWTARRQLVSPLTRARETAAILGLTPTVEPALTESDWGAWEGERLSALRERLGDELAANEARGLDFRPPGGTSPRELTIRLRPWLADIWAAGEDVLAVSHKGVIRALLTIATGWDMAGKPPVKVGHDMAVTFRLEAPDRLILGEAVRLCR